MTAPLSNDLRERVVAAVGSGESCRSVSARFGVAVSSVVKWSQRHRATGSIAPGKMGGHRRRLLEPHRDFIVARINETSHLTLHGLKDELAARGRGTAYCLPRPVLTFDLALMPRIDRLHLDFPVTRTT